MCRRHFVENFTKKSGFRKESEKKKFEIPLRAAILCKTTFCPRKTMLFPATVSQHCLT